jgi:hypothetical protein
MMDDAELRKYLNRLEYKINLIGSIVGGTVAFAAAAYVSHELQIEFDSKLIGGVVFAVIFVGFSGLLRWALKAMDQRR